MVICVPFDECGVKSVRVCRWEQRIGAYHRVSCPAELETNLTLDSILQHVIVNDSITNCVTATAIWTIAADGSVRYAWTHCLIGNLSSVRFRNCIRVRIFLSILFFSTSDTFDQKSRSYIFNGRSRSRRHNTVATTVMWRWCWSGATIVCHLFPKKNQSKTTKLIGSHSDRRRFCSVFLFFFFIFFLLRFQYSSSRFTAQSELPVCVCDRLLIKLNIEAYTFLDNSVEMSICFDAVLRFKSGEGEKCDSSQSPLLSKGASLIVLYSCGFRSHFIRLWTINAHTQNALFSVWMLDAVSRGHAHTHTHKHNWPKETAKLTQTNEMKTPPVICINANARPPKAYTCLPISFCW